jgi:hypothetical protein
MTSGGRGSEAVGSGQPYRGPHQAAPARGPAVQGSIRAFLQGARYSQQKKSEPKRIGSYSLHIRMFRYNRKDHLFASFASFFRIQKFDFM